MADETKVDGIEEDIAGGKSFSAAPPEHDPFRKTELYERPENIPEKFWDAEAGKLNTDALLKSYAELEKQFSAPKEPVEGSEDDNKEPKEPVKEPKGDEPKEPGEEPKGDEPKEPVEGDLTAAMEHAQTVYAETGGLDEAAREPFLKAGISNEQIDLYIQGVKAQEEGLKLAAMKAAGVDDYSAVEAAIQWAAEGNWSEKKILAFNAQANDVETIPLAITALFKDYRASNPGEGKLLGIKSGANRGDVYTSKDEYSVDLEKADALSNPAERRLARNKAVEKMRRSIRAKSL